jgi:hypothetical protein
MWEEKLDDGSMGWGWGSGSWWGHAEGYEGGGGPVLNLLDVLSPFLLLAGWGIDEQGWGIDEHGDPSLCSYSTSNLFGLGGIYWQNGQPLHN